MWCDFIKQSHILWGKTAWGNLDKTVDKLCSHISNFDTNWLMIKFSIHSILLLGNVAFEKQSFISTYTLLIKQCGWMSCADFWLYMSNAQKNWVIPAIICHVLILSAFSFLRSTRRRPTTSWRFGMGLQRTKCHWRKWAAHCFLMGSILPSTLSPFSSRQIFISPSPALPLTSPVSPQHHLFTTELMWYLTDQIHSFNH